MVVLTSPRGEATTFPVRGLIARSAKPTLGINEGLEPHKAVAIDPLPIRDEPLGDKAEKVGGEMGDADEGKDKEPGIDDYLVQIGDALFSAPPQIAIPAADMTGSRTPPDTRDRPFSRESDIFQVLSYRTGIAQVVVLVDKALIETLPGSPSNHDEAKRAKSGQGTDEGSFVHDHRRRCSFFGEKVGRGLFAGRKFNQSFAMKKKEQAPTYHVLPGSVRLCPVPSVAQLARKKPTTLSRVAGNKFPDLGNIPFGIGLTPIAYPVDHMLYLS